MQAIDFSAARDYCKNADNTLAASVAVSYNSGTNVLTFTDNTTYVSPDARKAVNITAYDAFGKSTGAQIPAGSTTANINLTTAGLDKSQGIKLTATVVSAKGKVKDGSIQDVATLVTTGNFIMEK